MDYADQTQAAQSLDVAARFIAAQPGGPERILDEHQPDDRGLCRGCTRPGVGTAYIAWPCSVALLAQTASRLRG